MNKFFAASLLIVFALGCKKGPVVVVKEGGPYQAPQGMSIAKSGDGQVAILVPSGWKRGGPSSMVGPSLAETMGAAGGISEAAGNPDAMSGLFADSPAEEAKVAEDLEKKGILIWVNSPSRMIPGEERTSFRIKRTEDGPKSLEEAAEAAKETMLNEGPIQYVELPIGKVARFEAKNTKIDGGELYQIVYLICNGDQVYNVRFVTQESPTTVQQIEKEVMDSLRITPAKAK